MVEVLCLTSVNLLNHCLGELDKSFMQTSYSIILASNLGPTEQISCLIFLTLYGRIIMKNAGMEQYSNLTFATTHKHHGRNISALEIRLLKYYSKSNSLLKQTRPRDLKSSLLLLYKISIVTYLQCTSQFFATALSQRSYGIIYFATCNKNRQKVCLYRAQIWSYQL